MNENQTMPVAYQYEGSSVTFFKGENVMVNATQMAKAFNKQAIDWLKTQSAKDFVATYSELKNISSADLVRVTKGGAPKLQGTWMHQDVALEFARWLSPKFAIWCNDRIKELMMNGYTTVFGGGSFTITPTMKPWERIQVAVKFIANECNAMYDYIDQIQGALKLYHEKRIASSSDAAYARKVLTSRDTWNTNVIAKEFGMSAVTLNRHLQRLGIQYKQHGVWVLSYKYQYKGYTKTTTSEYLKKDGTIGTRLQMEWTEIGRRFLHELYDAGKFSIALPHTPCIKKK